MGMRIENFSILVPGHLKLQVPGSWGGREHNDGLYCPDKKNMSRVKPRYGSHVLHRCRYSIPWSCHCGWNGWLYLMTCGGMSSPWFTEALIGKLLPWKLVWYGSVALGWSELKALLEVQCILATVLTQWNYIWNLPLKNMVIKSTTGKYRGFWHCDIKPWASAGFPKSFRYTDTCCSLYWQVPQLTWPAAVRWTESSHDSIDVREWWGPECSV